MPRFEARRKLTILAALEKGPKTTREISEDIGIPEKYVSRYLLHYRRQGLVKKTVLERIGKGRKPFLWELTKSGKKRLEWLKDQGIKPFKKGEIAKKKKRKKKT